MPSLVLLSLQRNPFDVMPALCVVSHSASKQLLLREIDNISDTANGYYSDQSILLLGRHAQLNTMSSLALVQHIS